MQDFTIFDMIILAVTLLLGLKGLFKGLIKEVFGIIGIIGAIFVASRISTDIGDLIAPILALENQASIKVIGFVIALVGFWVIVYGLGVIVSKIFSASGLGIVDRIFGFIFGASKVFLIFSVIAYSLVQVESFKKAIDEKFAKSMVMPHLISVGSYIIKLDTSSITKTVDKVVDSTKLKDGFENTVNEVKQSVEKEVVKNVEEKISESTNVSQEQIDTVKQKLESIANKPKEN